VLHELLPIVFRLLTIPYKQLNSDYPITNPIAASSFVLITYSVLLFLRYPLAEL